MSIFITLLIGLALANLWCCLHFAYTSARDLNCGGYPINGDAVHNAMIIFFAAFLAEKSTNWYSQFHLQPGWVAIAAFALNVGLIILVTKAGNCARKA